ncbi:MAG: hypothetical protein EOO77_04125 [Oxalobacteraceae bacterium]|nr:MAG: hypothetical protein EOO77_04125 [Oxalobacteraceae bacterium]
MTQFERTTLTNRPLEDSEAQSRTERIERLKQKIIEKSLEQHLDALNRLERWTASPWVICALGMVASVGVVSLGILLTKFVILPL